MSTSLSKKFKKAHESGEEFPLSKLKNLLKIKEIESKIEELNLVLDYIQTQIHQDNNIVQTIELRIEILQKEMEYFYILN